MARDYRAEARFTSEHGVEIGPTCGDCGVMPGETHLGAAKGWPCDTMICPTCRQQRLIGCSHAFSDDEWTYAYGRDLFRLTPEAEGRRVQALNVLLGRS